MRRSLMLLFTLALACSQSEKSSEERSSTTATPPPAAASTQPPLSHAEDVEQWRAGRLTRLQSETGWLTLIGLQWLQEGSNPIEKPEGAGTVTLDKGVVTLAANPSLTVEGKPVAEPLVLRDDTDSKGPTVVEKGTVRFNVIKRADKWGLRVKDSESEARKKFLGIEHFPVDESWRVQARFEPFTPPRKMPIANITGITTQEVVPGELVFSREGKEYRVLPILEEGTKDFFLIFKDATSGKETYGAARFVYAPPPDASGMTVIDFNKAYNPPCAFTPYATCPLPPKENRLPIRVESGEKAYAGHVEGGL